MSIFSFNITGSFDGSTVLSAADISLDKLKAENASELYQVRDGNQADFVNVGIVPLSALASVYSARSSYVAGVVLLSGTSTELTITPMIDFGGGTFTEIGAPVTANPADPDEPPAGQVLLPGFDYALKIETNVTEAQRLAVDLIPVGDPADLSQFIVLTNVQAGGAGGSGRGLTMRDSTSGPANIVQGTIQPYDSSGGGFSVTAPPGKANRRFGVLNTTSSVNAVNVVADGADTIEDLAGALAASASLNVGFIYREWQFDDEVGAWRIVGAKN